MAFFLLSSAEATADDNPRKKDWEASMSTEIGTWRNHDTIKNEVSEDTLDTWSAIKKRAYEVINILWVLVKKYDENGNELKLKARAVLDGGEQQRKSTALETDLNTFSPTPRNCTFKGMICSAVIKRAKIGQWDYEAV